MSLQTRKIRRTATIQVASTSSASQADAVPDDVEVTRPSLVHQLIGNFRSSMKDVMLVLRIICYSIIRATQTPGLFQHEMYVSDVSSRTYVIMWGTEAELKGIQEKFKAGEVLTLAHPAWNTFKGTTCLKLTKQSILFSDGDGSALLEDEAPPEHTIVEDTLKDVVSLAGEARAECHIFLKSISDAELSKKSTPFRVATVIDESKSVMQCTVHSEACNFPFRLGTFYFLVNAKVTNGSLYIFSETGIHADAPEFDTSETLEYL